MLHPLPKNVYSPRLVSTLAFTTHPPRCCEDHARLVAGKLANGKEPKEAIAMAHQVEPDSSSDEEAVRHSGARMHAAHLKPRP